MKTRITVFAAMLLLPCVKRLWPMKEKTSDPPLRKNCTASGKGVPGR